jgi:deoxycytidylate deaminase
MVTTTKISGANPPLVDAELVVAVVAPIGTDLTRFMNRVEQSLARFTYKISESKIGDLIANFDVPKGEWQGTPEYCRLSGNMTAGNFLRASTRKGEFLALAAAKKIRDSRGTVGAFLPKTAHLVRSLKHPDEVRALRRIYGPGFFLMGVTAPEASRIDYLRNSRGCSETEIAAMLRRDEHEEDPQFVVDGTNFGQRTRDTFHLADVFVGLDDQGHINRFFDLVFGGPHYTPEPDEYAMFLAFSAATRSADLSRQVGAVVTSKDGDVLALGANDVPKFNGGLYWPGAKDRRDHVKGFDSNERRRGEIVDDVLKRLQPKGANEKEWLETGRKALRSSDLMDITEYGRAVHAEMEALLACARVGVSPRGGTLYSTTFPCHNCAKHIVGAGITRVVYLEPYPKSQAGNLFADSIAIGGTPNDQVLFEPFVGVGARRFFDLFSMVMSLGNPLKRKLSGMKVEWTPSDGVLRMPLLPNSYLDRESIAAAELAELTSPRGKDHAQDPEKA